MWGTLAIREERRERWDQGVYIFPLYSVCACMYNILRNVVDYSYNA